MAERTRQRLLEAAEAVFVERGFHAAKLEDVADQAGYTTGAVYSRFDGKAGLFLAVLEQRNPRTLQAFAEAALDAETPADLIAAFGRLWMRRLEEGAGWSLALMEFWSSVGRDPALRAQFAESHEQLMSDIAEIIDSAADRLDGQLPMAALDIVRVTTALGHGLALEQLIGPDVIDVALMQRAFDALGGRPGADVPTSAHGRKGTVD